MSRQNESWEVLYHLTNTTDGMTVAQGHIKDYPSAEEALDRLGERVGTAVSAELLSLVDPAPWQLTLRFCVSRRATPAAAAAAAAAAAELVDAGQSGHADDEGIDLEEASRHAWPARGPGFDPE